MFCQGLKDLSWPSPGYGAPRQEGREDIQGLPKVLAPGGLQTAFVEISDQDHKLIEIIKTFEF